MIESTQKFELTESNEALNAFILEGLKEIRHATPGKPHLLLSTRLMIQNKEHYAALSALLPESQDIESPIVSVRLSLLRSPSRARILREKFSKHELIQNDFFEIAFRLFKVVIRDSSLVVGSYMQVDKALNNKGIGTLLFNSNETFARAIIPSLPIIIDLSRADPISTIELFVIDASSSGWTSRRALQAGYKHVSNDHEDVFPIFLKTFQIG